MVSAKHDEKPNERTAAHNGHQDAAAPTRGRPVIRAIAGDSTQGTLEEAESTVRRARMVSDALFREARRMPEYKQVLATHKHCLQFENKLLKHARWINYRLDTRLSDDVLKEVVVRLGGRIASWEHSPTLQRERQKKQVAARRRRNLGRDLQIRRYREYGESQRRIAKRLNISRGAVERVLRRDLPSPAKNHKNNTFSA